MNSANQIYIESTQNCSYCTLLISEYYKKTFDIKFSKIHYKIKLQFQLKFSFYNTIIIEQKQLSEKEADILNNGHALI